MPAFYRWLSEKYPKIVVDMLEDKPTRVGGIEIPLDLTAENPNGIEVRSIYSPSPRGASACHVDRGDKSRVEKLA